MTKNSIPELSDAMDTDDWRPLTIPVLGMPPDIIVSGVWGGDPNYSTSAFYNAYTTNTSATNGDLCIYYAPLAKGTYTMNLLYLVLSACGIFDVDISFDFSATWTNLTNIDGYSATIGPGTKTVTGIKVPTKTLALIRFHVVGKNASSSSYFCCPSGLAFKRTA